MRVSRANSSIFPVIGFCVIAVSAQAAPTTNSWTSAESAYWDIGGDWSLGAAPSITDGFDFITNMTTKTVTMDFDTEYDSYYFPPSSLTVSNVTVGASGGTTNVLFLDDMNDVAVYYELTPVPLEILNALIVSNGGDLEITNSILQVAGGTFQILGAMQLYDGATVQATNATISANASLTFALGSNSIPVLVSSNLALAGTLNVIDGGGFTTTNYTLFTYGGKLTYGGLAIGTTPSNSICAVSTNAAGEVNLNVLVVTPLPFQIISIVPGPTNVVVTWTTSATGTNCVQAGSGDAKGSYNTNTFQNILTTNVIVGTTNSYTDVGGGTNRPSRFYRIYYPE